jgi:hypothetical protein
MNSAIAALYPTLTLGLKDVKVTGGLRGNISADSSSEMKVFPVLDVAVHVAGNIVILYGGLDGGFKRYTFDELTAENPFCNAVPAARTSSQKMGFHAGFRGLLATNISFDLRITSAEWNAMPFYVTDTSVSLQNKFSVIYDKVNMMRFHAELLYHQWEKFSVLAFADYDTYKMDSELYPWMRQDIKAGVNFRYNLKDKILARLNVAYVGERKAKTFGAFGATNDHYLKINPYMELSLGLEYRYSKILSFFLSANNLTGNRYYQWNYYPSQRFSILGGLTYAL